MKNEKEEKRTHETLALFLRTTQSGEEGSGRIESETCQGDWCARMTLDTVSEHVEKRKTWPDRGASEAEEVVVEDVALPESGIVSGDVSDGTGEGYARREFSADGDRAHIAR